MLKASVAKLPAPEPVRMVSSAGIEYSVERVTPHMAEQWLTKNTANRTIRRQVVGKYARDMGTGDFIENGSSVCFAEDGTLLDGQHRLAAIVESQATVWLLVVRNLQMSTQDTMDDLAKRTLGDTFGFHGVAGANSAAAITRRIILWQHGIRTNQGNYQPSKTEALTALREDHTIAIAVDAATKMSSRKLVSPSIIGLTWWLFWQVDEVDGADFWQALHTGTGLVETSPIYIVREQLAQQSAKAERIPETAMLAWVIKAWNHWRSGKDLSPSYKYRLTASEKFPEPR